MKQKFSISIQLIILIFSVLFCIILASLFSRMTLSNLGFNDLSLSNPKAYLVSGFFSQVVGFVGGFILFLKITKQSLKSVINFKQPTFKFISIVFGLLIIAFPLMMYIGYLNSFLKDIIPNNNFILQEIETDKYQLALLTTKGNLMLSIKLIVIAILPAIGEELIFRGVILTKIKQASGNIHYAVIVSAVVFAGIHLQPTKLLPMIFLGIVLGYLYSKTKNIFYPMLFHFLFNGTTILLTHYGFVNL